MRLSLHNLFTEVGVTLRELRLKLGKVSTKFSHLKGTAIDILLIIVVAPTSRYGRMIRLCAADILAEKFSPRSPRG